MKKCNLLKRLSQRRFFAAAIAWLLFAAPVIASDILFKKEDRYKPSFGIKWRFIFYPSMRI